MVLHQEDKEFVLKLAMHEVGHYVVGEIVGFTMGSITLALTGPRRGGGGAAVEPFRRVRNIDEAKKFVEDRIRVLYAGCIAETIQGDKPDPAACRSCLRLGAGQDFAKIRELLYVLRCLNGGGQEFITAEENRLSDEAAEIVLLKLKQIRLLALDLAGQITAFGQDREFGRNYIESIPAFSEL